MNSAMIATDPLPADVWASIGWEGRETLGDTAHGFFYAQRTADDRIAIGGRASPYRYGSGIDRDGEVGDATISYLTGVLNGLFPQTRGAGIAHGWCGVLAVPRDWSAGVSLDPLTGLGWAGGYVGHGVTATNLAGQTLADLVLRRDTPLVRMPWVGHHSRTWEPEPLRWFGSSRNVFGLQAGRRPRSPGSGLDVTDRRRRRPHRAPALIPARGSGVLVGSCGTIRRSAGNGAHPQTLKSS